MASSQSSFTLLNFTKTGLCHGSKRFHPSELEIARKKVKYVDKITQLEVTFDQHLKFYQKNINICRKE